MPKEDLRRLEAFEMWIWRRMEKVSWTEHKTNEVLKTIGEERSLIRTKKRQKGLGLPLQGVATPSIAVRRIYSSRTASPIIIYSSRTALPIFQQNSIRAVNVYPGTRLTEGWYLNGS